MGAIVALQGAEGLTVEPGQSATCEMSISNTGTIVEQFSIIFMGDVAPWTHSEPPVVSLFPGAQQTVTLTFSPPRDHTTPAGEVHFGVKVIPSNEPTESVTEEGTLTVGSFTDMGAELVPRAPTGRISGRQKLAVDSRGNIPIPVAIAAVDAADALQFRMRPAKFVSVPGGAQFVRIAVRPRQRFWRGTPQQKLYQVQVAPEGQKPLVLDGAFNQKAILPKWLLWLLAAIAALLLLWYFVIKPAVHNDAVNANKAALAAQVAKTNSLAGQVASNQAAESQNQAAIAALSGKPVTTTTSTTTTTTVPSTTATTAATVVSAAPTTLPPPVTSPSDGRIQVVAAPGSTAFAQTAPIATGTTLTISDVVIQNVSGSSGTARIQRLVPGKSAEDLLVENLSNLTDQEFTFPTPIVFTHMQQMQLRVDCSGNQTACNVGVYYTGPITQPQSATTTTIP